MTLNKIIERDNLDELNLILSKKSEINFSQIKKNINIQKQNIIGMKMKIARNIIHGQMLKALDMAGYGV